jgi:hypothetical protein
MHVLVEPVFVPNHFWIGVAFGCAAGFFEEIGWTGLAFPTMRLTRTALRAAITLGLIWSVWHIPVIDYLGSATPHGPYLIPFFLAFLAAMTAMRVLICWVYANTGSLLLAQMLHAGSTGALAVLGPSQVTAPQEATWYAVYALTLWIVVAIITKRNWAELGRKHVLNRPLDRHRPSTVDYVVYDVSYTTRQSRRVLCRSSSFPPLRRKSIATFGPCARSSGGRWRLKSPAEV